MATPSFAVNRGLGGFFDELSDLYLKDAERKADTEADVKKLMAEQQAKKIEEGTTQLADTKTTLASAPAAPPPVMGASPLNAPGVAGIGQFMAPAPMAAQAGMQNMGQGPQASGVQSSVRPLTLDEQRRMYMAILQGKDSGLNTVEDTTKPFGAADSTSMEYEKGGVKYKKDILGAKKESDTAAWRQDSIHQKAIAELLKEDTSVAATLYKGNTRKLVAAEQAYTIDQTPENKKVLDDTIADGKELEARLGGKKQAPAPTAAKQPAPKFKVGDKTAKGTVTKVVWNPTKKAYDYTVQ